MTPSHLWRLSALVLTILLISLAGPAVAQTFYGGFKTVDQIYADLAATAAAYPDIVEIVDYGDSYAKTAGGVAWPGPGNLAGDDLLAARVTRRAIPGPKPAFFLMAGIHAAEITTPEITLRFLDQLTAGYGVDPDLTWIVDHHEIWIVPTTNPDGHRLVEFGAESGAPWFWRKNANVDLDTGCPLPAGHQSFGDSATYGVDMNRNFDHQWDQANDERAGADDPCSSYYHGPSPASEPEVAALQSQLAALIPDQRGLADPDDTQGLFIQLHSPFEVIGSPWAWTSAPPPNQGALVAIGEKFARFSGYPHGQSHDIVYQMTGTADGWAYGALGVPAFLIELGESTLAPYGRVDDTLWPENKDLFLYAARIAQAPFRTVRGPDTVAPFLHGDAAAPTVRALIDDLENGGDGLLAAQYTLGQPPWAAGVTAQPLTPVDGAFSGTAEIVEGQIDVTGLAAGRHLVFVRGQDLNGDWGAVSAAFLHVGSNSAPSIDGSTPASPAVVQVGGNLTFSVSASDPEGDPLAYAWRLDGFPIAGAEGASFTFFPTAAEIGGRTLTASVSDGEIAALQSWQVTVDPGPGGPDITTGLLGYWKLDEATGEPPAVADASGNGHDATVVGDPLPVIGQVDGAFELDGSDAFIVGASSALNSPPSVTMSAWIRHPATQGWRSIIDKRESHADGYDLYIDPSSQLYARINDKTLTGPVIADDLWHHVAGVYDLDSRRLTLYVDGAEVASSVVGETTVSTAAPLQIGKHWDTFNAWLTGPLDEVRVYGRALVAAEIQALYEVTGGPDVTPPVRSNGAPSGPQPAGTEVVTLSLATDEEATCRFDRFPGTSYNTMEFFFPQSNVTQHSVDWTLADGGPPFYVRCTDGVNVNDDDFEITFTVATGGGAEGLIAHWTFDDAPGSTVAVDSSGNGHDASAIGDPAFVPAQLAGGLELDGNDALVVAAAGDLDAPDNVTVAAWIQHPLTSGWRSIVDKRDGRQNGYDFYIDTSSRLYMRVNSQTLSSGTAVADGLWHHVAGVYDGTDLVLYVDGVEDGRLGAAGETISTSSALQIGRNWDLSVSSFFTGQMDDLRIYDRALTAGEIATLAAPPAGNEAVTLNAFVDKRVVQRVSHGAGYSASFAVSGTYSGLPSAIEARVVTATGGTEVVPWTTVDNSPENGTWDGSLASVPQGGWYRVEARAAGDPGSATTSTSRFGVGMIVAAIGQSNMVKHFTEDEADGSVTLPAEAPHELTYRYGYGEPPGFEYARNRNDDIPVSWGNVTGTGGIRLANNLQAALGIPVLILDFALDWTGVQEHWNDTSGTFLGWPRFAGALSDVGAIEAVLWHQGAYDGQITSTTPAFYKAGLDTLYTQITDLVGGHGTLPFVLAIQNRGVYNQDLPVDDSYNAVRRGQLEWIEEHPYGFAAGNSVDIDLSTRPGTGDGHFFAAGYEIMADRYTRGLLHAVGHPGYDAGVGGGRIAAAELQGQVVVVDVAHDQGTRLTLPDPTADVEGFTLSETPWVVGGARNELEITSAVLSGDTDGNQVLITLAEAPSGPIYLRYLHGQNPFHAKPSDLARRANGNTLYDNFAYHPGRSGLPINGTTVDIPVLAASTPSFLLSPTSLAVAEDEGTATFTAVLGLEPASDVVLQVTSADPWRASVDVSTLTFSPVDWSTPQPVTVTSHAVAGANQVAITVSVDDALSDDTFDPLADQIVDVTLLPATPSDLEVWLQLDETGGAATAVNAGANGVDGAVAGDPLQGVPGAFGTAFSFDELDDEITLPNFAYPPEFTVSLWIKVADNSGNYYQYLYSQGQFGDPNSLNILLGETGNNNVSNELAVNFRDADDPQGIWSNVLTADASAAGFDLIDDGWHLVTFTVSAADGARLYVDGQLADALPSLGGGAFAPAGAVTLGTRNYSSGNRWLGGSMDDVRVYSRALSAGEIQDLLP